MPSRARSAERRRLLLASMAGALGAGCAATGGRWNDAALDEFRQLLQREVQAGRIPGAVLWVEREGRSRQIVVGQRARWPMAEPLDTDTVYDVASLTKPLVATLVLQQFEAGRLALDEPVGLRLEAWAGHPATTLSHLLTHTSGLPSGLPRTPPWQGRAAAVERACRIAATDAPGRVFRYSDVNFILLGAVLEQATGMPLSQLAERQILAPLRMSASGYLPLTRLPASRIAPTQLDERGVVLRGEVHDPTARLMGGVAGHAGLFATAADLAAFARAWLGAGAVPLLRNSTIALATQAVAPAVVPVGTPTPLRGLGWDIDSSYSRARGTVFTRGASFGHTGFTGCAMWIDPGARAFSILLTNRVHPHGGESIVPLYEAAATAAARAAGLGS